MALDQIELNLLREIADLHQIPEGAYNIRLNGESAGRNSTENITIEPKTDKPGINIYIKPGTKNEACHIPVMLSQSGITEVVYNDFFIGEDADVTIVAGCGIHNCGTDLTEHDGVHTFHVGKISALHWVWCIGRGPHLQLRQEPQGSSDFRLRSQGPCRLGTGESGLVVG